MCRLQNSTLILPLYSLRITVSCVLLKSAVGHCLALLWLYSQMAGFAGGESRVLQRAGGKLMALRREGLGLHRWPRAATQTLHYICSAQPIWNATRWKKYVKEKLHRFSPWCAKTQNMMSELRCVKLFCYKTIYLKSTTYSITCQGRLC